jgi:hypothetical protein
MGFVSMLEDIQDAQDRRAFLAKKTSEQAIEVIPAQISRDMGDACTSSGPSFKNVLKLLVKVGIKIPAGH